VYTFDKNCCSKIDKTTGKKIRNNLTNEETKMPKIKKKTIICKY